MTIQSADRTCQLRRFEFPRYWEETAENPQSAEAMIKRITELCIGYVSQNGEGMSVCVTDNHGNKLHVGCIGGGWVIMHDPKNGLGKIALGNCHASGHQAFLFPEWTDVARKHLVPPGVAQRVVKLWVETGQLSDAVVWVD
jgi:Immunity protein Imm1